MVRQAVEGNFAVGVHYQAVYGKTAWEPPLGRLNSLYQHRLGQEFMVVIHILMGNQYYIFLLTHTVYRPPDVLTHSTNGSSSPISRLLFILSIVSKDEVFMIAHRGRGGQLVDYIFTAVYSEYAEDDVAYQKNTVMSVQEFMTRFSRLDRQSTRATQGALNERLRIVATLPKPYTMKHTMLPVIRRRTTGGIVVSDDHNAANNDIDTELDLDSARSELSNLAQVGYVNIMVRISPSRRPKI
ncbi:Glutathione S-transferase 1 [Fusarium oxysporum f. sp. albedinis]|nr:Glutathione S-transferase 1 [Fusarium oxysporum f. sp. albedinis]